MRLPHERFDFAPPSARPPLVLPKGARLAVYVVVNVESWNIEKPLPRQYVGSPANVPTIPDVPNWAWHEYGMRVGIWRMLEALAKRRLRACAALNASVVESEYEPVARAMRDAGWEFMGHGVVQGAMHTVPDQRAAIRQSFEMLERYTGTAPKGWLGPGLHETWETLDHLAEAGYRYVVDWPMDEEPFDMRTAHGPILSMPYTLELSDLPMMVVHQHASDVWQKRAIDHFDRLWAEGARRPRVTSMSVHPYILGVPHRMKYFEAVLDRLRRTKGVWLTTAGEIHDWYRDQASVPAPAAARSPRRSSTPTRRR